MPILKFAAKTPKLWLCLQGVPKQWLSETTGGQSVCCRASRHAIVNLEQLHIWMVDRVPAVSKSHFFVTHCVVIYLFSSLGSICSSICHPLLAQVARQQKRLDARVMWLAAFSQVAPDIRRFIKWAETMELVCRMSHLMKLFCQHCTDTRIAVAEKVQKSSFWT